MALLGAMPSAHAASSHTDRQALLLEIATRADQTEAAAAAVVAAQMQARAANGAAAAARARVVRWAVAAYVHGHAGRDAPRAYLELAAAHENRLLPALRAARHRADEARAEAQGLRVAATREQERLAAGLAVLDAEAAAAEAERTEELRRADEARRRATEERAAARAREAAAGAPSVRHRVATERQARVLARHAFGPLPAGALPSGLRVAGAPFRGAASWYGPRFDGRPTASGALFDRTGWTTAHRTLPLGTMLVVTRGARSVLVLVNDRGPYVDGRVLDLSEAAARALGIRGVEPVDAVVVAPG